MLKKILVYLTFAVLFFLAGFITNNVIFSKNKGLGKISFTRSGEKGKLTNPLLDCELYTDSYLIPVNSLKSNVDKIVNDYPDLSEVSVYYRDLNNGPWFGINEKAQFAPASLLKVPLMIAYLKKTETNPDLLNQKILYSGTHALSENLDQSSQLTPNQQYSIDELISRMIGLSDNIAFELLLNNIDDAYIKAVHKDLDMVYPNQSTPEDYITVRSYASLFRVLFNSTYLTRTMSEKALNYLIKSDFDYGIRAGVTKNVTVANKFGVKDVPGQDQLIQLHDCGIVYAPDKPYLLCIMTKGTNRDELVDFIQNVSKEVFESLQKVQ